ncbi:ABC transporter substrate-binding protein [Couchioplanes caeruleus]|uniref:ABC transporter substrate-binding protein n=2 Tax=Couchioplanes caeruleus TaxID=56438 RepID=A0A1K0FF23_9ACTN|nr:ABC transporter substrate-binding protein [Couchioplanes caeruleus]OJF11429.1 ABC transporter substrate-binding protein [Couchioplanes caeruleus subsp. caeruleus]ROP27903.1 amino acid ABC transporter substrate-binding protein (PAAT family) [Couchioplanes caeruleus]
MRKLTKTGLAVTGVLLALAGCGGGNQEAEDGGAASSTIERDQALHDALPQGIRERGTIRLVTDPTYAPMESYGPDGRTIIGFEPDLAAALGTVLGVKVEMIGGEDFGIFLDEAVKGTYDGVLSSMTDTAEREKKADFINYFAAGTSIVVQRGNPSGVTDLKDLCGKVVAVEKGTVQVDLLERSQQGCGNKPITVKTYKTNADALLQLRTGRSVAVLNDFPPAVYLTTDQRTRGFYQLASTVQYEPGLYGIAVPKGHGPLRDTLRDALDRLIRSGAYAELLERWGLSSGALTAASINAAGGGFTTG